MSIKHDLQKLVRNKLVKTVSLNSQKIEKIYSIPREVVSTLESLSMNFSAEAKRLQHQKYNTPEIYTTT